MPSAAARFFSVWRGWRLDDAEANWEGKPATSSPYYRVNRSLPASPIITRMSRLLNSAAQQRRGLPLDENDLLIAATAIAMNATLVSRDSAFRAIEGLLLIEP